MILPTFALEEQLYHQGYKRIAGIDEAGRGAWAGPIVGAAVILPREIGQHNLKIRDSKTLSPRQREALFDQICQIACGYQITVVDNAQIDQHGITHANITVVQKSALDLNPVPDYCLMDKVIGKLTLKTPHQTIIDGDAQILSIAAASILAKVFRDRLMRDFSTTYPQYGFDKHVGYGTHFHQKMLEIHGPCQIHRKSYKPIYKILNPNI